MTDFAQMGDDNLVFFDRLASLASSRHDVLPASGHTAMNSDCIKQGSALTDHDTQYEHMTTMTGYIGCDMEQDYLIAFEHITEMARCDGTKLRMWSILHATGLSSRVDVMIAASLILGAVAFISGEWLVSLLPI